MKSILLRNGRVIDPANDLDTQADVLLEKGKIAKVGSRISAGGAEVIDAKGALATLMAGFAMGLFRLAVDTPVKLWEVAYEPGSFLWIVNNIFFQYYSLLITLVCVAVMLAVSYSTQAPSEAQIAGLTFGSTSSDDKARSRASWSRLDVVLSGIVLMLILVIYLTFTG